VRRADEPDRDSHGDPKIVPLHNAAGCSVSANDTDPRGLPVVGADGVVAGKVCELWLDVAENLFRYLEVELADGSRRVLLPMGFARIRRHEVKVGAILGRQFADVPGIRHPELVTMLEEERIQAYYGAGTLYAEPGRAEPLL
jgi:photosynthetic reaction center H subunit